MPAWVFQVYFLCKTKVNPQLFHQPSDQLSSRGLHSVPRRLLRTTSCRCSSPLLPLPLLLAGSVVYLSDDCFTSHILALSSQLTRGGRHQAECPVLCDVTGAWGSEEQGCVGRWLSVGGSGISGVPRAWQPPAEWQLAAQECWGGSCGLTPGSSALQLL